MEYLAMICSIMGRAAPRKNCEGEILMENLGGVSPALSHCAIWVADVSATHSPNLSIRRLFLPAE